MNTEKPRFTAIYAFLIVAAIVTILSSFFLSCVSWEERSAVDRTKQFNAGLWDRERGEIFDRDKNVLVYNTAGEKENDLDRHYDKCSEAYSAIIGYYGSYVEYIESEDGSEPKKVTHERREGLESSMSEWLLLGDDIENTIGGSIVLTTDSRLQELCYKQIKDFDKAAVVVIDIETGELTPQE